MSSNTDIVCMVILSYIRLIGVINDGSFLGKYLIQSALKMLEVFLLTPECWMLKTRVSCSHY